MLENNRLSGQIPAIRASNLDILYVVELIVGIL